jgi:hypothetical protein
MWWHGGAGLTERSELAGLSAVATHDVFGVFSLLLLLTSLSVAINKQVNCVPI